MIRTGLSETRIFFLVYLLLCLIGCGYYLFIDHGFLVWFMHEYQNPFLDGFFTFFTKGGTYYFLAGVSVIILIYKRRHGLIFISASLVLIVIAELSNHYIFSKTTNKVYFEGTEALKFNEVIEVYDFNGFPSAYTMTAFLIATFLTLMMNRRVWSMAMIVYAFFVGTSRIYLQQHFLIDVIAGSLMGALIAIIFYFSFENFLDGSKSTKKVKNLDDDLDISAFDFGE